MKKLLNFSLLLVLFCALFGCRSKEFDPIKGVYIQLDLSYDILLTNGMKKDEAFDRTRSFNLRDTFVARYNIDPNKLDSFFVNELYVTFDGQGNCKKLKSYEVTATLPIIGPTTYTRNNPATQCDLPSYVGKPAVINWNGASTEFIAKTVLKTNFAPDIKAGKFFDFNLKMVAAEPIDAGVGATIQLKTRAVYKP